jgi:hypothetical protein
VRGGAILRVGNVPGASGYFPDASGNDPRARIHIFGARMCIQSLREAIRGAGKFSRALGKRSRGLGNFPEPPGNFPGASGNHPGAPDTHPSARDVYPRSREPIRPRGMMIALPLNLSWREFMHELRVLFDQIGDAVTVRLVAQASPQSSFRRELPSGRASRSSCSGSWSTVIMASMPGVSARALKDQLSSYLRRVESGDQVLHETDEPSILAEMSSRGLVVLPKRAPRTRFQGPALPNRGKLASEMVLEDRR